MVAIYTFLLVCTIELPSLFCLQESSHVLIETILEELQNVKNDLAEAKQQIQVSILTILWMTT